jgi:hypothetical protein
MATRKSKDVYWVRQDVLGNQVSLYVETFDFHVTPRHGDDLTPATEEHIYQTIIDPDHARRTLDPAMAGEACIFQKFFDAEQQNFLVPVLYDEIAVLNDYEQGGKQGKVLTGYFPYLGRLSGSIGEIFWSKDGIGGQKK